MIPKIIHYCWLSSDPIPKAFQEYIDGWKKILEGYSFIKWDFSRFDKTSSMWVAEAFDSKRYAFAADYIRLYAVYYYGGIYLDMDVEVIRPFDELLEKSIMIAAESPNCTRIEAGCFGAEKGNSYIGLCLERYNNRRFIKPDGNFDLCPLPQVMEEIRNKYNMDFELYPWDYFTAKSFRTGIEMPTDQTYAIHHFAGSWKTEKEKEQIEMSQRYCKLFGLGVGHNIAEYYMAVKDDGIRGVVTLTFEKVKRKIARIKNRSQKDDR